MPTFTVFPESTRQAGEYRSNAVTIPAAEWVQFTFIGLDLSAEPTTTSMDWGIDVSDDGGATWRPMVHLGGVTGGETAPRGYYIYTILTGLEGQLASGWVTANARLRYGIDGEIG